MTVESYIDGFSVKLCKFKLVSEQIEKPPANITEGYYVNPL